LSDAITFTIDGIEVTGQAGQTILQAADGAGIYIPRLCWAKELAPGGHCRVCTVLVNGRPQSACTHPIGKGLTVQHDTPELQQWRKSVVEMLFVEGNHFCPVCEKSGNCELQAMGYRMAVTTPAHTFQNPKRLLDASHPDVFVDGNRCILCGRCVRASRDVDGKNVFQFVGRGTHSRVAVNSGANLAGTNLSAADAAARLCPVGSILVKRVGYAVPVGRRLYDQQPIGSDIEGRRAAAPKEGR
jgi:[NiFe] hydrogenase diaphorase moiety small subunit